MQFCNCTERECSVFVGIMWAWRDLGCCGAGGCACIVSNCISSLSWEMWWWISPVIWCWLMSECYGWLRGRRELAHVSLSACRELPFSESVTGLWPILLWVLGENHFICAFWLCFKKSVHAFDYKRFYLLLIFLISFYSCLYYFSWKMFWLQYRVSMFRRDVCRLKK